MLKNTKRNKKRKIKKEVEKVLPVLHKYSDMALTQSDINRSKILQCYVDFLQQQAFLPTRAQIQKATGLSEPTVIKYENLIMKSAEGEYKDKLKMYKDQFITMLLKRSLDKKTPCMKASKLLAQIFGLMNTDTTINLNKQTVTSFKIVSNENEKKIEGIG